MSQDDAWGTGGQPTGPWQQPGQAEPAPAAPPNPWDSQPGYGQPPPYQPGYGQPGHGQPGVPQPGVPQPGLPQPGYGPPPGQPPSYGYVPQPVWRPKPGIIPLRPITMGEIYDGAFQAIRSNPRTMMGVAAAVLAVTTLLELVPQSFAAVALGRFADRIGSTPVDGQPPQFTSQDAGNLVQVYGLTIIPALLTAVAVTVVTALVVVAVSEAVLGRRMAPGPLWRRVRRRIPAVVGLALLPGLAFGVAAAVVVAPVIALVAAGQPAAAAVVGLVLGSALLVGGIYLGVSWSMAGPALLLENLPVVAALNRSRRLVSGSWWRILGISLLTSLIVGVASSAVQFPASLVGSLIAGGGLGASSAAGSNITLVILGQLVTGIGTLIAGSVLYPFQASVNALMYIDLRMRREGLDVDLMRAAESGAA